MVMQVKKATFQRMEVMERVELKIDGLYQVQDSLHHRKYILYFHGKYIKKSAADRRSDDRSVRGDTAVMFCKQDDLLYTSPLVPAEESIPVATAPYLVLFQLRPVGILYRVGQSTRRHIKDRNLSA